MNSIVHSKYKPSKTVIATTLIVLMLTAIALPLIPLASAQVMGITVNSLTTNPSPLVSGIGGIVTVDFTVATNLVNSKLVVEVTADGQTTGKQTVTTGPDMNYHNVVSITIPASVAPGSYAVKVIGTQQGTTLLDIEGAFVIISNPSSPTPTPSPSPSATPVPVATTVVITPADTSIPLGASQTYIATASDSSGNTWDVTGSTTFTTSAGSFYGSTLTAQNIGASQTVYGVYNSQSYTTTVTVLAHGDAASIAVSTDSPSITAGQSATFTAIATDRYNNQWTDNSVIWGVSSSAGGSWSGNVYTSAKAGSWTVAASVGSVAGTTTLTVSHGALTTVVIGPSGTSVAVDTTQAYTATAQDNYGNPWDVTSNTVFSSNAGIFSGSTFTAQHDGSSQIVTGTFNLISYTTTVTVTGHGSTDSLSLNVGSSTITADSSQAYVATATDVYGNTWVAGASYNDGSNTVSNPVVEHVAGSYTITATYDGKTATANLVVIPAALDHVIISPTTGSIVAGGSQSFSAIAYDQFGNLLPVTASYTVNGVPISGNVVTETKVGSYTVTATCGGKSASATLSVTAGVLANVVVGVLPGSVVAGSAVTLTAEGHDRYGNDLGPQSVVFTVNGNSVSGNSVTETVVGSYTVSATTTSGLTVTTANFAVTAAPLTRITISPAAASIVAGGSQSFSATAYDQYQNSWPVTASYTVNGVPISGNVVTETKVGSYTVTATCGDKSASATLSVTAGALANVVVGVLPGSVVAGNAVTLTAQGYDQYGNPLGPQSVTFTVNGNSWSGNSVTENLVGSYTVSATTTSGVTVTTASFSITHAALDHVSLTPAGASLNVGDSQTYTATAYDAFNNHWDVTSGTTFSSGAGSFSGATFTAQHDGSSQTINGLYNSQTYTTTVSVSGYSPLITSIVSITISTGSSSIAAGQSATFTAIATDNFGNQWIDTSAKWSIDSGAGGSWSNTGGVYTAAKAGTWTVTATDGTISKTFSLTVTAGALSTVVIAPSGTSVAVGATQSYTATAKDSYGNTWDVTSSTTFTSNAGAFSGATFTAQRDGTSQITGTYGSPATAYTTTVTVTGHSSANSIVVSASSTSIKSGQSVTFTATATDSFGNTWTDTSAKWSIDSGAGGTWSSNGNVYTAAATGTWIVTATDGSAKGTISLTVTTAVDTTPPTITHTITGTLGNNGWYTSDVTVTFTATDSESKITSQGLTCPTKSSANTYSITCDTWGITITYTATSAGGTSSDSVTIKRDATKPCVWGTRYPCPNDNGWNNQDVTVSFYGVDLISGIASTTAPVTVTKEGAGQTVTGTVTDKAGNTATYTVSGINIDKTKPTISISVPGSALVNQPVTGTWTASDSLSGIDDTDDTPQCDQGSWWLYFGCHWQDECSNWNTQYGTCSDFCPTDNSNTFTVNTCTAGVKTGVITVTDKAGNTATRTWTINVGYKFGGFLSPLPSSSNKAGSTIPVKFQILDYYNKPITCLSAVDSITANGVDATATGNTALRCDSNQYVFNLSTKGMHTGSLTIAVTLADGNTYSTTTMLK